MAKYKAKKDYAKSDKTLADFGDYQKHMRLVRGMDIDLDPLPDEYKDLVEPCESSSSKKVKNKEDK